MLKALTKQSLVFENLVTNKVNKEDLQLLIKNHKKETEKYLKSLIEGHQPETENGRRNIEKVLIDMQEAYSIIISETFYW